MIKCKTKFPPPPTIFDTKKFIRAYESAAIKATGLAVRYVESEVKSGMPSMTGKTRGSVSGDVISRRGGRQVIGIVGSPEKVAIFLEEGTRPHWAPLAPLTSWAKRKTGNPRFGKWVRLKIAGMFPMPGGTPAFKNFEKAFDRTRRRALQIYRDGFQALTKELSR